jgi:hypothetical protein
MEVNPFRTFFRGHRGIRAVLCNGGTAFGLFTRRVLPELREAGDAPEAQRLPSTSPAHASLRPHHKRAVWHRALRQWLAS